MPPLKLLEPSVELTQLQVEIELVCPTNSPNRAFRLSIIKPFNVEHLTLQRHVAVLIGKYLQNFRMSLLFQNSVCKQSSLGLGRIRYSHRSRLFYQSTLNLSGRLHTDRSDLRPHVYVIFLLLSFK